MNEPLYTPEEFAKEMHRIVDNNRDDSETCHMVMDDLICNLLVTLGYAEGALIFKVTKKFYA